MQLSRRQILKLAGTASAAAVLPLGAKAFSQGSPNRIRIGRISPSTFRITIGHPKPTGSLVDFHDEVIFEGIEIKPHRIRSGDLTLDISGSPIKIEVLDKAGAKVQTLGFDSAGASFRTGDQPLFGLGEGGRQFDRRGAHDTMVNGQGGYRLQTFGGRVPIPFLVSPEGWALFFHHADGTFDLTGTAGLYEPKPADGTLDMFVIVSKDPATIMAEYIRLTGHPELPPLWGLGYLQSHRTLGSPDSLVKEAMTFREKKLPCEAMIYLGTGFCPNGWNVKNGSFDWNERVFPDPKATIAKLHDQHFKTVLHAVIEARQLEGRASDKIALDPPNPEQAASYWNTHRPDFSAGVGGWWPDEGDWLDMPSRLARNRMYWEGPQIDRPNERPFALHRNGAPGMQRFASFLWSGDVYSHWETLKNHIPIAINTGVSGIPLWGTDIGGFVPTSEFTAELYLRWFQFGAFCPLFRCHGRNWTLRLPWGWNTGDSGPQEVSNYRGSGLPDPSQLHNAGVEPICQKYLNLRSRLMPYLYSAVRESTKTGMPVMRGLWFHYADDPNAVGTSDVYLWGRDMLVAPIVEKDATSRSHYLPKGMWYDFWTGKPVEGGRVVTREVDLETIPLYVRAGAIIPMGPIRQYVDEPNDEPLELHIYPGADGQTMVYEDDGKSFDYQHGDWAGLEVIWKEAGKMLSIRLARGSKMRGPNPRPIKVVVDGESRAITFTGHPMSLTLDPRE